MNKSSFLSELKRRNVIRAAILYFGGVWALAQGISQLGPSLGAHGPQAYATYDLGELMSPNEKGKQ